MYTLAQQRLEHLVAAGGHALLKDGRIGLEKECLRVNPEGSISQKPHPRVLGSALTNPYLTTDYSEALLEFITPPAGDGREALEFLRDAQQFVYRHLEGEILWATSMPCVIAGASSIPVAGYGTSNAGRMKTVYRRGLGQRYGRVMQVIAGVHFNHSFSDAFWRVLHAQEREPAPLDTFINERYMGLLRNLQRIGWIIPYLFGASPAVCKSFLNGKPTALAAFDEHTYYEPYATSLRMGDIGYQNNRENELGFKACYDSLPAYVESLARAIETPCPRYREMGVVVDGEWHQLNANILQIENEYYSTVRPKQVPLGNEKPTLALAKRGVRYFELRSLDVNAFEPMGVSETQLHFLEALSAFCLLHASPPISTRERLEIDHNEMAAAHRGREPGLRLARQGAGSLLRDWAAELLDAMTPLCEALDRDEPEPRYLPALEVQKACVADPERTPSARMLAEMRDRGESFYAFARRMSECHHRFFLDLPENPEREDLFHAAAARSLAEQHALEAADEQPFEAYLRDYFAQH